MLILQALICLLVFDGRRMVYPFRTIHSYIKNWQVAARLANADTIERSAEPLMLHALGTPGVLYVFNGHSLQPIF